MPHIPKALIAVFAVIVFILIGYVWQKTAVKSEEIDIAKKTIPLDLASGDTNNDLLRSLMLKQNANEKEAQELKQQITNLEQDKVKSDAEKTNLLNTLKGYIDETKELYAGIKTAVTSSKNEQGELVDKGLTTNEVTATSSGNVITEVNDLSVPILQSSNFALKNPLSDVQVPATAQLLPSNEAHWQAKALPPKKEIIPYITIPKSATLADVKLMTSLIAEVPVAGKLLTPAFPFKAIVGRKDLITANGIYIPKEAAGMVLEGYSVGDMSLGCARGYITNLLFVFDDGHFVTFPEKNEINASEIYPKDAIGYISNEYNSTCIPGKYLSNAAKVLGSQALMGAVAGAGGAIAEAQTSTMSSTLGMTSMLTQDTGKFIAGKATSSMAASTLEWFNQRIHDVFDAIYVPAVSDGAPKTITVHITKTINIDYDKNARSISNETISATNLSNRLD